MKPLRAGPINPVPVLARGRPYPPGESFRRGLPCHPPVPRPDLTTAQGKAGTRTLLEESP
jgi:hypothetical protein